MILLQYAKEHRFPNLQLYVDAPDKSSSKCRQHIHIKYDGIGFIPLDELMKKETA